MLNKKIPASISNLSFSSSAVNLGETVHNGLFLVFSATMRGVRFVIVTDHRDWVSAIFDDLHESQAINSQPVLFINYMSKKWDLALEKIMSL